MVNPLIWVQIPILTVLVEYVDDPIFMVFLDFLRDASGAANTQIAMKNLKCSFHYDDGVKCGGTNLHSYLYAWIFQCVSGLGSSLQNHVEFGVFSSWWCVSDGTDWL